MKMVHIIPLYCMCLWHLVGVFGNTDEVESVSVKNGDSVTLNTGVPQIPDDLIEWRFNSIRIARANIPEYDDDERFRDRLKLDPQTGSLTITNTRTTDSGEYKLQMIVGNKDIIKRFNVTVYIPSTTVTPQHASTSESEHTEESHTQTPESVSLTVLIAAPAAAGSLLIVAAVVIFWICKKCRKTDREVQTHDEDITYADPTFYKRKAQTETVKQEDEVVYAGVVTRR